MILRLVRIDRPDRLRRLRLDVRHVVYRRSTANNRRLAVDKREHLFTDVLSAWTWQDDESGTDTRTDWSVDLEEALRAARIPSRTESLKAAPRQAEKSVQFEAVKRSFEDDSMRIEPKLRTSIVEGVSVFLSLFDDNPRVKYTFCPPKETYDPTRNPNGIQGTPLPPLAEWIEHGNVVALNFPMAMNPLARALGTMLKQDFQRAVLNRVHQMDADPSRSRRPVLFVCDEYQAFATTGENEASGDEMFFSLARQARCIPMVATQSTSSLRSTLSGIMAHAPAGPTSPASITEAGRDARVSMLTGWPVAHGTTLSAAKKYTGANTRTRDRDDRDGLLDCDDGAGVRRGPSHGGRRIDRPTSNTRGPADAADLEEAVAAPADLLAKRRVHDVDAASRSGLDTALKHGSRETTGSVRRSIGSHRGLGGIGSRPSPH